MKLFFVLLLATVANSARDLCQSTDDHDLILMCDTPGELMHRETVEQPGYPSQIHRKMVTYPQQGPSINPIGCIKVIDLVGNGLGGCPEILLGGTGFSTVIIEIISQTGQDIHHSIEIYSK